VATSHRLLTQIAKPSCNVLPIFNKPSKKLLLSSVFLDIALAYGK
jgi:hypothetical protein